MSARPTSILVGLFSNTCLFLLTFSAVLHDELEKLRQEAQVESFTELTKDMHMYPDLHGTHLPSTILAECSDLPAQVTDHPSPTLACGARSSGSP